MTDADRQILQNHINCAYTTATAKANARILASGNPLPEQPSLEPENSAEDRQAALDSHYDRKKAVDLQRRRHHSRCHRRSNGKQ